MTIVRIPVTVVCTFVWIGFVCAISFMEAWLKFRAPGITVPLGLGIGRLVFGALNKVEWIFAIAVLFNLFIHKEIKRLNNIFFFIPVLLLVMQTLWLLPELDTRAQLHIDGADVPPSNLHFWFVGFEVVKTISLFIFGISLFKTKQ